MRKYIFGVLLIAILICFTGCGSATNTGGDNSLSTTKEEPSSTSNENRPTRLSSPIVECDNLEDASERAGFDMIVPETIEGYTDCFISVYEMDFNMIQVIYSDDKRAITIRKAPMSEKGAQDISGVYMNFKEKATLEMGEHEVLTYGEQADIYKLACWNDDSYNYSLYVEDGVSEEVLQNLIAQIG